VLNFDHIFVLQIFIRTYLCEIYRVIRFYRNLSS